MPMIPTFYLVHGKDGSSTLFHGTAPAAKR